MNSDERLLPHRNRWLRRLSGLAFGVLTGMTAATAELPVPCAGGSCGASAPTTWVTSGTAGATVVGNTLTVQQSSSSAVLNWRSFNVSPDGTVNFVQPDASSIALNRIFDGNPTRILGALNANGRIYLLNQNGIVFGEGSTVNVGGLVASSLNITPEALANGIAGAVSVGGSAAFDRYRGSNGQALQSGAVQVEAGAKIEARQGQILLIAPEVTNRGTLSTPDGQTILAAGDQVYLATSSDPNLRGLFVEVRGNGTVVNGEEANTGRAPQDLVGRISADRGNVTLAGLLVRQDGHVSASTSTRANGSVRLLARATTGSVTAVGMRSESIADTGGTLRLGAGSVTAVTLDATDKSETVDVNAQPRSRVQLSGRDIEIGSRSRVVATAGDIDAYATVRPSIPPDTALSPSADPSRLVVASDAVLDVSGATADLPMERNVIRVELRGNQLADSPLQRSGPLRSEPVFVDVRRYGTRSDGSTWVGTPLADVSGDIANVRRGVAERNLTGGEIRLRSTGAVLVGQGANLDVSGGAINWQSGYVNTSRVLGADGRIYDIADADRDRPYVKLLDPREVVDPRWGVTSVAGLANAGVNGRSESAYVEGRDAGRITIVAPQVLLDGNVVGRTEAGRYQRLDPAVARVGAYDRLPLGARLVLGVDRGGVVPDYVTPDVVFAPGFALNGDLNAESAAQIPASLLHSVQLRPELFGDGAVSNLTVLSNGQVTLPADVALRLPQGGGLTVAAARANVAGDIAAPSGTIDLSAGETVLNRGTTPETRIELVVGSESTLSATGGWVNDDLRFNPDPTQSAPLFINGGTIRLSTAGGALVLEEGSIVDVSAGAQRRADGTVVGGRGGSISIAAVTQTSAAPATLALGAELRGFALSRGGSLSVSANSVCISMSACNDGPAELLLRPEWFTSGGFGSITVDARNGRLTVADDATLVLQQRNYELLASASDARTGADMNDIAAITLLADHLRRPLDLTLRSGFRGRDAIPFEAPLTVQRGAALLADPGAKLALTSGSSAYIDGLLQARGGSITITVDNSSRRGYYAEQGLWLGDGAVLDVSGTTILTPNTAGQLTGRVLDGGTVSLLARRGFVVTGTDSRILADGTRAQLDIAGADGLYTRQDVATRGGNIVITAAEGMLLNGRLSAASGQPGAVEGGSLTVRLDTESRLGTTSAGGYPLGDREIVLANASFPVLVGPGQALPASWLGRAFVPVGLVSAGGFDSARFAASNVTEVDPISGGAAVVGYGRIAVEPGVDLHLPARLALAASSIGMTSAGGEASLASHYLELTRDEYADPRSINALLLEAPAARVGQGSLNLSGDYVDVYGSVTIDRTARATINSATDLRLSGVLLSSTAEGYVGELRATGQLTLNAQQIYPSTLTDYTIAVTGDADSRLVIGSRPGTPGSVLSAAGALTLLAPNVDIAGRLRAPMGQIDVKADAIDVRPGGVLSVSAAGQVIPFGTTQSDLAWAYELGNDVTLVFGPDGRPLPEKRVTLDGAQTTIEAGGLIDVSGGGDLLGYEFVPGPGGTADVLSPNVRPNQFAILPGVNPIAAHFDPSESVGSTLAAGTAVWIAGGSDLPEGVYTLLPARYALLPGAYLVTAVGGYTDLPPGQVLASTSGGKIVAGAFAVAGTTLRDSRTQGFEVRPGSTVLQEARYDLSRANEYFADIDPGLSSTRLPQDAGTATLLATVGLTIDGELLAKADGKGRGSTLEIGVPNLVITDGATAAPAGAVAIADDRLVALGAQTIFLGGRTATRGAVSAIDVRSDSVTIAAGAQLRAPELLLVANDLVRVESGATVEAAGAVSSSTQSLELPGNAALLRVSTAGQVTVARPQSANAAQLDLQAGATVRAPGSITIDVAGGANVLATLDPGSGSLGLGASRIALGGDPATFDGIVISDAVLAALRGGELALNARSELVLFDGVDIALQSASLTTPRIMAGDATGSARIAGDRIELTGTPTAVSAGAAGGATLQIAATDLVFNGGELSLDGFSQSTLSGTRLIEATGDGRLTTQGALAIAAPVLTTAAGADYSFETARTLSLGLVEPSSPVQLNEAARIGGQLAFVGSDIRGAARIVAPSGIVALRATQGDIDLQSGTVINVAGEAIKFDGVDVSTPGGRIELTAANGSVALASDAVLDVSSSGVAGARAGSIALVAPNGSLLGSADLRGAAPGAGNGGSVRVLAQQLDFAQLLTRIAAGGFDGRVDVQQRGAGDLVLASGQSLRAAAVRLVADAGAVRVDGNIDARAARGGTILLASRDTLAVNGALDARASDANIRGGSIELASESGVLLGARSSLNVAGTTLSDTAADAGGLVRIRSSRDAFLTVLDPDAANDRVQLLGTIAGARRIELEGVARYDVGAGYSIQAEQTFATFDNPWYAEAAGFAEQGDALLQALGADPALATITPGIEIVSDGDLQLAADWNLREWHFGAAGDQTGILTLRAAGNLLLDGSLNDGFGSQFDTRLAEDTLGSWSYRLAAGVRPDSADPLAVLTGTELLADTGDVIVGAGQLGLGVGQRFVRTGTGDIAIAAGRDFLLTNAASVVYTAGEAGPGIRISEDPLVGGLLELPYPINAGSISISAGRDAIGGNATQLYTPWLLRTGAPTTPLQSSTAWTVDFGAFEQGIAAVGGGNVLVNAGRDVRDLSVSLPSIGRQVGGTTFATSVVETIGGGDLSVIAGRDVAGGQFYVDRGVGRIDAAGSVGVSSLSNLAPILALGDASLDVTGRRDVAIATALNPTLLWPIDYLGNSLEPTYFTTYSDRSAVSLLATGGNAAVAEDPQQLQLLRRQYSAYPWTLPDAATVTTIMAPTLRVAAPTGALTVGNSVALWPAPKGNLQLFAQGDVVLAPIMMSDAAVGSVLPTPATPTSNSQLFSLLFRGVSGDGRFNAPVPVHGPTATDPVGDLEPARIVSLTGDIRSNGEFGSLYVPKAVRISAGRDISGLSVQIQHFAAGQVSSLIAGRDFTFPTERDSVGSLRANLGQVIVDGPGTVEFLPGRDFDLQTSRGVVTRGNITNRALPSSGANVSVAVGLNGREPDYDAFIDKYLVGSTVYDTVLRAYVTQLLGAEPVNKDAALLAFETLDREQQRPLLQSILFAELRTGGRAAAAAGPDNGDYSRAFTALETYLPGSNPDPDAGEKNAYAGDIRLFFSRIYTLDGGNIGLLAPGGEINVGLASPPTAFGLTKQPSDLGLVVQSTGSIEALAFSDFQVNESRTFAADGGNILIWSTRGDIDAGRGAKTAISAPPPQISIDPSGQVVLVYPAALSGSGIQTLATTPGREPGDVDLFAPRGVVDAGDAGIVAGNLTIGATAVLGANNIQVTGTAVGVPVDSSGLGASLTGVSSVGSAAGSAAETAVDPSGGKNGAAEESMADTALSWLDVFVVGLGDESCDPKDVECLQRQKKK